MKEKLYEKFLNTVKKHELLAKEDSVIVGLSGGADSVCLLLMLLAYKERACGGALALTAVHYHHGIRGEEADGDEAFCRELCDRYGVAFYTERGDVPAYAKANKMSAEEAARVLRYRCFARLAEKTDASLIAVAHTAADRAETVLLNIARGTSVDGLKGIVYRRNNIIRPLLDFTRDETESVCREAGVSYRVDSTNADCHYTRNRIRHEVIPYLDRVFGGDFAERLLRLAAVSEEDSDHLQQTAHAVFRLVVSPCENGCCLINGESLRTFHPAIGKRVLRLALSSVRKDGSTVFPDGTGLDQNATERVYEYIAADQGNGYVEVSNDIICTKWGDRFLIGPSKPVGAEKEKKEVPHMEENKTETARSDVSQEENERTEAFRQKIASLQNAEELFGIDVESDDRSWLEKEVGPDNQRLIPAYTLFSSVSFAKIAAALKNENVFGKGIVFPFEDGRCYVRARVIPKGDLLLAWYLCRESQNSAVLFDGDALFDLIAAHNGQDDVVIRNRKQGDIFKPYGKNGGKPLRRFFTDRKIPPAVRDFLPVIACGNEILHIFYLCRSNFASVHKNTRYGIMIKICELQQ